MLFLELTGEQTLASGADLTEQPKIFLRFNLATSSCSLTTTDLFELKKTARTWFGCEQLRPKFTPT